jgi:hypothetical protein
MSKTTRFVDRSDWAEFKNSCARFMRSLDIEGSFKSENATHLFNDSTHKREGFYAIPLIGMFISLGFESYESLCSIDHSIGNAKVEKIFFHLRSLGRDREMILHDVMKNWSKCPPMLRDQFIKFNPNKNFTNIPFNPDIQNIDDEIESEVKFSNKTPTNITEWDVAFAKFILKYMVEYIGYSNYEDIRGTFVLRQCSQHFLFKGKIQKLNGSQFKAHTDLIKQFARENKSLLDINVDKIYFDRYVDVLRKILILFPFDDNVLSEFAINEIDKTEKSSIYTHHNPHKPNPQSTQPLQTLSNKDSKTPKIVVEVEKEIAVQQPILEQTSIPTLTPLERKLIDVLIDSISLDRTQKQMLKDTLKSSSALSYFLEKL